MITVISAVYGGYDLPVVLPPQNGYAHQQIFVMDGEAPLPEIRDGTALAEIWYAPAPHLHPRMAAKVPKCRPDLWTDDDIIVWIDGSIEVTSPDFLAWLMRESEGHFISQMAHPLRDDIIDEAHASIGLFKYKGMDVLGQADYYTRRGHPRHSGLWATGLIVYHREVAPGLLASFGDAWLREQLRWTYQDQISQPVVARDCGERVHTLSGNLFTPQHFTLRGHRDER